MVLLMYTI